MKCFECGFINFSTADFCKRCGKSLNPDLTKPSFTRNSESFKDYTGENRAFGVKAFAAGIASSIAPWILTFGLNINVGKLNAILVVFGFSFVVAGLGVMLDPPKTKLDAEENKTRNGILIFSGLLLGLLETFIFNKALGVW